MSNSFTHFGCPFYNETLDKCGFSEKKVKKADYYKAQCSSESTQDIYEREKQMPDFILESILRSIATMPPSYVSWQRKMAIERIIKEKNS